MPGLITHYIFGKGVLAALPPNAAADIQKHRQLFNIGCQGPDMFFYYVTAAFKKDLRGLGGRMHKENVGAFMKAMACGITELKGDEKRAAFAYFSGYLAHYALDCSAHPYVYYRTGFLRSGEKGSKMEYSGYHVRFETAVDVLLLKAMEGKRPGDEKIWKLVSVDKQEVVKAADYLSESISDAYDVVLSGKNVSSAMAYMALFKKIFQSGRGMRKKLLGAAEKLILRHNVVTELIHPQEITDDLDYLNENKNSWRNPWDEDSLRQENFAELFEAARIEAAKLITALWEYTKGRLPLKEFLELAGDRSFDSGRPISERVEFKVNDIIFRR